MRTSNQTELLKPEGDAKISAGTLAYINARTLLRAYSLVIKDLKDSGITQAQLAKRLGKAPEVVSRMLNCPRNWELKTFSELLFAISGAVLTFSVTRPLEKPNQASISFYKAQPGDSKVVSTAPSETDLSFAKISNVQIRRDGIGLNPRESTAAAA